MNAHNLQDFLNVHEGQLLASKIPQHFWPTIYEKLKNQDLDAGECFQIIMEENDNGKNRFTVSAITNLNAEDEKNIFLIDHAWTFRLNNARLALQEVDSLRENLASIFDIKLNLDDEEIDSSATNSEDEDQPGSSQKPTTSKTPKKNQQKSDVLAEKTVDKESVINAILDEMWRYAQTYTIRLARTITDESDMPVWYLTDNFGMKIGHSLAPNCRMVPFYYAFEKMAYSLLFPISDIIDADEITRNYLDNALVREHPDWTPYLMNPWEPYDFLNEAAAGDIIGYSSKTEEYFLSGRVVDELPLCGFTKTDVSSDGLTSNGDRSLRVFVDDFQLIDKLHDVKIEQANDMFAANLIWLREHFHLFKELAEKNSSAFVNQFPYESSLTVKDLFAAIVQSVYANKMDFITLDLEPKWFPTTFNLQLELPQFMKYFHEREKRGMDNTWIVKPWNLARGLDVFVTRNVNCIIRLAESGPKIVCKYIHNPMLFRRPDNQNMVKFDLRYIVFLRSVEPLDVAIYNKFWTRFAVNEFNLEKLDDVLTHLTVHNYNPEVNVLNVECVEFIHQFEELYPAFKWSDIQQKINCVIKDVLRVVSTNKPPRGLAPNPQSRAMYGFDLMLYWKDEAKTQIEVSFIEANFMPDCTRACDFYPTFADTVFQTLFLNKSSSSVTLL